MPMPSGPKALAAPALKFHRLLWSQCRSVRLCLTFGVCYFQDLVSRQELPDARRSLQMFVVKTAFARVFLAARRRSMSSVYFW